MAIAGLSIPEELKPPNIKIGIRPKPTTIPESGFDSGQILPSSLQVFISDKNMYVSRPSLSKLTSVSAVFISLSG